MYEPLIIPGTHRLDGLYKSVHGVHTLNSRPHYPFSKFQSSYALPHNLAIKDTSGTATNYIHTREISSLRLSFCKKKLLGTRLGN